MRTIAQFGFICWVGFKDVHFSERLIQAGGLGAESNTVARHLVATFGATGLAGLKAAALTIFFAMCLAYRSHNPRGGDRLILAGTVLSAALTIWWDLALWSLPIQ